MPWLGTFHSLSVRILRRHAELVGLKSNFTILDVDDQVRLLRQIVQAAPHRREALAAAAARQPDRRLEEPRADPRPGARLGSRAPTTTSGAELYAEYQERLTRPERLRLRRPAAARPRDPAGPPRRAGAVPALVPLHPRRRVPGHQRRAVPLAAAARRRATATSACVGDDDQSIYGWRGAEVGNILRFEKDFPGAGVDPARAELPLDPAHPRRRLRRDRRERAAGSARRSGPTSPEGEKVRLIGHWDGEEEARWIGEEIEALGRGTRGLDPVRPDGIAILVRASLPDARLRGPLPDHRPALPRHRRPALLRAPGDPRRDGLLPRRGLARRRPRLRAHRQRAEARHRRQGAAGDQPHRARERRLAARRRRPARRPTAACRRAPAPRSGSSSTASTAGTPRSARTATTWRSPRRILEESGYTDMWRAEKSPDAAGPPRQPQGARQGARRVREPAGLPRARQPGHGERDRRGRREGQRDDAARRQGPRVPGGLPARLGGRPVPVAALDGRERRSRASRRSAASPTSASPAPAALCTISFAANRRVYNQWQSQLPSRFVDELPAGARRGADPARPLRRRLRRRGARTGRTLAENAAKADVYNSPGWKRMQARAGERPVAQPREAQGHGDRRHRRRRLRRPAPASSTRSSATAPSPRSRATS